jgi:hypothetical protein
MSLGDPADIIRSAFGDEVLNFDAPPPGMVIGPLHALFQQAGLSVMKFQADSLMLEAEVSVQNASGPYLDAHGVLYGVARLPGDTEETFRTRILAALHSGRITCPAIRAAVQAYEDSQNPGAQAIVTVWDLQTQPELAAMFGIVVCQFVIDIDFGIPASKAWFMGRSFMGRNTFVIDTSSVFLTVPTDAGLVALVLRSKGATFQPVWHTHNYIIAGE